MPDSRTGRHGTQTFGTRAKISASLREMHASVQAPPKPLCSIPGCTRPAKSRGWCNTHHSRWLRRGSPLAIRPSAEERFEAKVRRTATCWEWDGPKMKLGYARFRADGRSIMVHRWSYEHYRLPVPDRMELDHLCHNRGCVNPWHLEAVSHTENMRRGDKNNQYTLRRLAQKGD